ncbi:GPR1/FUN34/YaaH family transporter [Streptomyces sp. NPDC088194]|uniref:GPR1/FUN34/YaaH family transporter n=1 Tax=Streptomyces sp. NPDC088194 TaxID=3154931 RepID=UPI00344DF5CD
MADTPHGPAGEDPEKLFPNSNPARHEDDLRSMVRINLRPLATPMPVGLFTVAIDSVVVSSYQYGILPQSAQTAVALVVFPAFVIQVIVGIFALLCRDATAATLMMSFAASWLIEAGIFFFHPAQTREVLGIFLITFAVFVLLILLTAAAKRALAAVLLVAAPRFLVSGIAGVTGNDTIGKVGAVLGFLLAGVAMYTAWALLFEETRGRAVLPVGRIGPARATSSDLAGQLRDIERQAGVRRTL